MLQMKIIRKRAVRVSVFKSRRGILISYLSECWKGCSGLSFTRVIGGTGSRVFYCASEGWSEYITRSR